jgi:hypothetical protein
MLLCIASRTPIAAGLEHDNGTFCVLPPARLATVTDRLTEERVITQGGWHPDYARVLLIQEVGDEAIVRVDGNGDGADVEREQWFLTDGGWAAGSSGGVGAFDRRPLWTWGSIGVDSYVIDWNQDIRWPRSGSTRRSKLRPMKAGSG